MGMYYHLECLNCKAKSNAIEFSVVNHISLKLPDVAVLGLINWSIFLIEHSGHNIAFMDSRGEQTNPSKITGAYVLGLE